MKTYIDNNVLSIYVARAPSSGDKNQAIWVTVRELFELARRKGVRFLTSEATTEEAKRGNAGAAAARRVGLRAITVRALTRAMRRDARRILEAHPDPSERTRLLVDALHFCAAAHLGARVLVTTDTDDFAVLNGLADKVGLFPVRPNTEDPEQALRRLGFSLNPPLRGLFSPTTPWLKRIHDRVQKVQLYLATRGPYKDVLAPPHTRKRAAPRSRPRA